MHAPTHHTRGDIQGLRAVAVLGVVFFHADRIFSGGFIGVDVFFVISGFVIAGSILRRRDDTDRVSMLDFYRRRALRIVPALIVFLIGSIPLALLGPADTVEAGARTATSAALFVANLQLLPIDGVGYFSAASDLNPYLHMWSLSVEEQFYLGFPILVLVGLWWGRRRGGDLVPLRRLTVAAIVGSFLFMGLVIAAGKRDAAFYLAPTRAWEFLAGALLAILGVRVVSRRRASMLRVGGLVAIAATMVVADGASWPGLLTVVTVAATVAVIAAGPDLGSGRRALDNRTMRFLGDVSYSWYLWHWPFAVAARTGAPGAPWLDDVAVVVALVPAWLSLRWVEDPIRHRSSDSTRRVFAVSGAALAIGALVVGVILPQLGDGLPGSVDDIEAVASIDHVYAVDDCASSIAADQPGASDLCGAATDQTDAPTAVLVGDSVASQVAVPFDRAAAAAGWRPLVRSRTSCAFLPGLDVVRGTTPTAGCASHNEELYASLLAEPPDLVVISNKLSFALTEDGYGVQAVDHEVVTGVAQRRAAVVDSYNRLITDLRAAGTDVVLLRRTPPNRSFNLRECARWRWTLDEAGCGAETSLADALDRRAADDAVLDELAREHDLQVVDFDQQLCLDRCVAHDDRGWVYTDAGHITAQFADGLDPLFAPLFMG